MTESWTIHYDGKLYWFLGVPLRRNQALWVAAHFGEAVDLIYAKKHIPETKLTKEQMIWAKDLFSSWGLP